MFATRAYRRITVVNCSHPSRTLPTLYSNLARICCYAVQMRDQTVRTVTSLTRKIIVCADAHRPGAWILLESFTMQCLNTPSTGTSADMQPIACKE